MTLEISKVSIVGMGALGLLFGARLLEAGGDVCFLMDDGRLEKNKNRDFLINGVRKTFNMQSAADRGVSDLIIVAVKANGLDSALDTMAESVGDGTVIISVMNGITSEEIIGKRFGFGHLVYCVAQSMDAMRFGSELKFTKSGELRIGAADESQNSGLEAVVRYFDKMCFPYTLEDDIVKRLWSKFMLNVGINQCCMVYETTYSGCLCKGEPNRTMLAAFREVIAIANAEGVDIGERDINEYIDILSMLSPDGIPSMRQDAVAGRKSEVELFSGTVVRIAKKHGLYVPTNEFLYEKIKEMEEGLA